MSVITLCHLCVLSSHLFNSLNEALIRVGAYEDEIRNLESAILELRKTNDVGILQFISRIVHACDFDESWNWHFVYPRRADIDIHVM